MVAQICINFSSLCGALMGSWLFVLAPHRKISRPPFTALDTDGGPLLTAVSIKKLYAVSSCPHHGSTPLPVTPLRISISSSMILGTLSYSRVLLHQVFAPHGLSWTFLEPEWEPQGATPFCPDPDQEPKPQNQVAPHPCFPCTRKID